MSLFAGVNDSGMVSAVATIAVQVADALQQVISVDSYRMLMSPDGYAVPGYSTKICDYSLVSAAYDGRCREAMNVHDWDTPLYSSHDRMRADSCKLVNIAVKLFQCLTAKAKEAGICIEGVDVLLLTVDCCVVKLICACAMHDHEEDLTCWQVMHASKLFMQHCWGTVRLV